MTLTGRLERRSEADAAVRAASRIDDTIPARSAVEAEETVAGT